MFKENYIITGKIVCKTGLHIGGSNVSIDIGGSDNVVIRDAVSGNPYIPGSALKGKLRFLTELNDVPSSNNIIHITEGKPSNDENCIAAKLFGVSAREDKNPILRYPTRTIVRDAFPDKETEELWKNDELIRGAELKWENVINRINSSATPRSIERVPRGSKFDFEIIYAVYDEDDDNIIPLLRSMCYLEDNYLGGSGSRGFGKVKFEQIKITKRSIGYYKNDEKEKEIIQSDDIDEIIKKLQN